MPLLSNAFTAEVRQGFVHKQPVCDHRHALAGRHRDLALSQMLNVCVCAFAWGPGGVPCQQTPRSW